MKLGDYYRILDLPAEASIDDIKTAYRKKARLYHPDLNPSDEAMGKFVEATEAYEFLISYQDHIKADNEAYKKAMDDWRKYRQDRSRWRATVYARTSYSKFKNTNLYKTTRIFDGTTIIFSLVISVLVILYTVTGYIYRLKNPVPGQEKPSLLTFILLLLLGIIFFVIAFIYLYAWRKSSVRHKHD